MRKSFTFTVPALAIALVVGAAGATTLVRMDSAQMAQQADAIVLGRCLAAESQWVGKSLVTTVRVGVGEALKGLAADEITLVIPGGVDASGPVPLAVTFPGAPVVYRNEDVLLFLQDSNLVPGGYDVVGFNQGKFSVLEDPSGSKMLSQGTSSVSVPLDQMKGEIASALADAQ